MDKKHTHIDNFLRDKLGNYSEVPPSDAWLDMDKKLDTLVPHTPVQPYRWLSHIGIVSLIAVLGVSVASKFSGGGDTSSTVYKNEEINKLEGAIETPKVTNSTQSPQAVTDAPVAQADAEQPVLDKNPHVKYDDALAFGESYSENADNEYVEGVTEIKKEDYSDQFKLRNGDNANIVANASLNNIGNTGLLNLGKNLLINDNQYGSTPNDKKANNAPNTANKTIKPLEVAINAAKPAEKTRLKANFTRWELGIKAGYERGFDNVAAKGFAVSPYVTYNISEKLGITTQPTVKMAVAATRNIGSSASYYKANNDATVTAVEHFVTSAVEGTNVTYYNNTRFRYTQSHDSIVKTNQAGGRYTQFELPVLLNYKLGKKVAVYGGVNTVFSQLQSVTEHTYTKAGIQQTAEVVVRSKESPSAPAVDNVITHNGTSYAAYNGPIYPESHENNLRVGAMIGVNYEYNKRWLVDAMVQKTPAPANVRSGYNMHRFLHLASVFR